MRWGALAIALSGRVAAAGVLSFDAPLAAGVASVPGLHAVPTVGGHFGVAYGGRGVFVEGGVEWTLLIDRGQMPQTWLTVGAALPVSHSVALYAGPSLRLYELDVDHSTTGVRFGLTGELGVRALPLRSSGRRHHPGSAGVILRGTAPIAGADGAWTATIAIASGPVF